jgi:hypothetical protein
VLGKVASVVPAGISLALFTPAASSQTAVPEDEETKTVRVVRVAVAPVVDGKLDEAIWQRAESIDDFHQIRPGDGSAPTERTEVYLLYDDDYLYIGAKLFDSEPDRITANVMRHGNALGEDDRLAIVIDPFNTGRNGYRFETNANGVRHEMLYHNITELQSDWTVIWDTNSSADTQGWSFEMALPFKSLPFDPQIDTWGINFARGIRRKGEEVVWVSRNRSYNPSILGQATGFSGMDQGVGLDVVPSLSVNQRKVFAAAESDTETDPSLDVFYRITPSLNGSLTFNTDFSATEVDDRQVNLTRFSLFFPEKRDFFLNDSDLFEFGRIGIQENQAADTPSSESGRPFFSRRIGLSATGVPVDLKYGGKLSGRVGRWSIGSLAVRQDDFGPVEESSVLVARVQADVLEESNVGLILTQGDPTSNLDNSLSGFDFQYQNTRLRGDRVVDGQIWYQRSTTDGLDGDDAAFGLAVNMPNAEGFRGGLGIKEIQSNFYPAVGFVSRSGVRDYTAAVGYTHFVEDGFVQSLFGGVDAQRIESIGGGLQTKIIDGRLLEIESRTRDEFELSYSMIEEVVDEPFTIYRDDTRDIVVAPGDYSFDEREISVESGGQRTLVAGLSYLTGGFYDGERVNIEASLTWKPSRKLNFRFAYDWNDIDLPQGAFTTRLAQFAAEYAFSLRLAWVSLIQYDNVSEVLGVNSRLHWIPRAGREGFVVLNHNLQDFDKDNRFHSALSDVSMKFGYTFRF